MIGKRIAHYEIGAKIGEGGMGEVYRATDTRLNRDVAIKLLPADFTADKQRLARFEREAQLLAALNHPNIAAIYGLEKEGDQLALVLELVEGPTLAERIAAGPLPQEEALRIALQIAEALESAHEKGIIHRDLKPANVKLTPDGAVKVLDFGLAKAMDDTPEQSSPDMTHSPTLTMAATQAGIILGTAAYMSPEQAKGAAADRRADVWSFGVVLWEMLTAQQAFEAETISETLAAVMLREPDFDELPDTIPLRLKKLIERCLTKDPRQRLQAIGEARIGIEQTLAGTQEEAEVGTTAAEPTPSKLPWILLAVTTLALVAAGVSIALTPAPDPPLPGRFELDTGSLTIRRPVTAGGHLAISPDGRTMAVLAFEEGQPVRIHVRRRNELNFVALAGTEEALFPTFSPDSQWIAFAANGAIKRISVDGGLAVDIAQQAGSMTWGAGSIVFTPRGSRSSISRVPEGGGTPALLAEVEDVGVMWPSFVPETDRLLVTLREENRFHIATLTLSDPTVSVIIENGSWPRYLSSGHILYAQHSAEDTGFTGGLLAVPFDADSGQVTGSPIPVLSDVRVHSGGASNFDVSAEGSLLFWPGGGDTSGNEQLSWLSPTGAHTLIDPARRDYDNFDLSRDGRFVVYERDDDIYLYDLGRGIHTRLTFTENNDNPVLSPDGRQIAFQSTRGGGSHLWRKDANPGAEAELINSLPEEQSLFPDHWSPDGRSIVYGALTSGENFDIDLWTLPLEEGAEPRALVATPFIERHGRLSPDGKWLAFTSGESGPDEVFVQPYPDGGPRVQVSASGGWSPRWAPDGSRLYFVNEQQLMAADVIIGESLEVGVAEPLVNDAGLRGFRGADYDVAADGRFLVAPSADTVGAESERRNLRLLVNFVEELKARIQ